MCNSAHAHSFDYKLLRSLLPGVSGNEYWITHIASLCSAIRPKRHYGKWGMPPDKMRPCDLSTPQPLASTLILVSLLGQGKLFAYTSGDFCIFRCSSPYSGGCSTFCISIWISICHFASQFGYPFAILHLIFPIH
jgi:hypothetical protein